MNSNNTNLIDDSSRKRFDELWEVFIGSEVKCPLCDILMVPLKIGRALQCTHCRGSWEEPL